MIWPNLFPSFLSKQRPSVDDEITIRSQKVLPPDSGLHMENGVLKSSEVVTVTGKLLTTKEIIECYGNPGDPENLTIVESPFRLRIAWDTSRTTTKITCHKKIALPLMNVFNEVLNEYGYGRIGELGINLFGGLYNFRPQRGTEKRYETALKAKNYGLAYTYLSRHAWAIAIDLDPARNQLKTKWKDANFSKPEYRPFVDAFHRNGFIGYGPERNYDAMHWEIGVKL